MAATKPTPPAPLSPEKKVVKALKVIGVTLVSIGVMAACIADSVNDGGSSIVSGPDRTERTDTVTLLRQSAEAQGVCYGWKLLDGYGYDEVGHGSSLGDNVAVEDEPTSCPRWALVTASIYYPSASSESSDSATLSVTSSPDLHDVDFAGGLKRLGIDEAALIDDPGWAITRAAVFLPLIVAEAGKAQPVPAPTATPTGTPAPLPAAGSDFWRDRWLYLLGGGGLLLLAALLVAIGIFERRHERRSADRSATARGPAGKVGGRA